MLTSAVKTPHFTASAPFSIAPCSLYAPSLSLYFASTRPPPHCVTRTASYSSWVTLTTRISLCRLPPFFFFSTGLQSARFNLSAWFIHQLSVSPPVANFLPAHLSVCHSCERSPPQPHYYCFYHLVVLMYYVCAPRWVTDLIACVLLPSGDKVCITFIGSFKAQKHEVRFRKWPTAVSNGTWSPISRVKLPPAPIDGFLLTVH